MAEKENTIWPMPKFRFQVSWGDATIEFSEVSGLDTESPTIEYRHSVTGQFAPIKMPGIAKVGNVTMKRGLFVGDETYWDWFSQIKLNTVAKGRETVVIRLLDDNGKPTMTWTLNNAWPTKITTTDLGPDGNEAAIDTLELAFETLVINNQS